MNFASNFFRNKLSQMIHEFLTFIQTNNLLTANDKVLVAVSGGPDSVALMHLFTKTNYYFEIAHVNFKLRDDESDTDAEFVRLLAAQYAIKLHIVEFNTTLHAKEQKISVEMAARQLRYNWFNQLCLENNLTKIAIAHNNSDSVETMLLNLARGTGLKGLLGIKIKNKNIIRPLVFATRDKIETYLKTNNIPFKTDSTNLQNIYHRNKIRNQITPLFETINPSFKKTMYNNAANLLQTYKALNQVIKKAKKKSLIVDNNHITINLSLLKKFKPVNYYLYEILFPYGFNPHQTNKILKAAETQSGKKFLAPKYVLITHNGNIIIQKRKNAAKKIHWYFPEEFNKITLNLVENKQTTIEKIILPIQQTNYKQNTNNNIAFIDNRKLRYPLIIRKWNSGDYFYPLGMQSKKKLSDFFIDSKLSIIDKKKVTILESDGKIVWIIGFRLDNRYKITQSTTDVCKIVIS